METFIFQSFPPYATHVHIALFRDVENAADIRKRLISAATMEGPEGDRARKDVDFAFVDASLHLLSAIYSTILTTLPSSSSSDPLKPNTKSHNLHSELLIALSPNNNISDALRKFGVSDTTKSLLVVRIGGQEDTPHGVWKGIEPLVQGCVGSVSDLDRGALVDWPKVDKTYKISEMNQLKTPDVKEKKIAAIETATAIKSVT